jgi:hypothetical protein
MITNTYIPIEITDTDYYYMIENQVRESMPKFEVGILLPQALQLLEKSNINKETLLDYPIEGYYYKSAALREYFTIIRNLQHNEEICKKIAKRVPELDFLTYYCQNELFGEEKEYPEGIFTGLIKRRYDILTLLLEDSSVFNPNEARPWNIPDIMSNLSKHYKGRVNLVELAYLTGNPKCLCGGAESNTLYRMYAAITGCFYNPQQEVYIWNISKEMEYLGKYLINRYNNLIGSSMVVPNIHNHLSLNKKCENSRAALLGKILTTGEKYYWIIDKNGNFYDKYTTEDITSESLSKA